MLKKAARFRTHVQNPDKSELRAVTVLNTKKSMECSSMVSIAAFGPGDPGSNPGRFAVLNSN